MKKFLDLCKRHSLLLFAFFTALLVLGICSKSSPLYPMNDWVDVHCFFTMGKGMLSGQVLYRDLYEQKGPVLYFIYALAALVSDSSFLSVFALEVASFTMLLYYTGRIVMLYSSVKLWPYASMTILAVIIGTAPALAHGGSVEQLCLSLMAYGWYITLRSFRRNKPIPAASAIVCGLFAGMVFWIKFTMIGFFAGLCLSILLWYLLGLKDAKALLRCIGQFLLGFGAVTAIVFAYFLATGAMDDLFTAYFYNNLFLYPSDAETSKLQQVLVCLKWALHYNSAFAWFIYIGGAWLLLQCWERPWELICGLLSFAGICLLTYWGGKGIMQGYGYYDLVLSIFVIFGLCGLGWMLSKLPKLVFPRAAKAAFLLLLFAASALLCWTNGRNTYLMSYKKEDMPQYKFAQIINTVEAPTLLNYGFLDGGFYYAADVVPNCRFFCTFNVEAPDMWQTQWDQLWAGDFDFVVTRHYTLPSTFDKYELVATADMMFESIDFTYYLYQNKDTK